MSVDLDSYHTIHWGKKLIQVSPHFFPKNGIPFSCSLLSPKEIAPQPCNTLMDQLPSYLTRRIKRNIKATWVKDHAFHNDTNEKFSLAHYFDFLKAKKDGSYEYATSTLAAFKEKLDKAAPSRFPEALFKWSSKRELYNALKDHQGKTYLQYVHCHFLQIINKTAIFKENSSELEQLWHYWLEPEHQSYRPNISTLKARSVFISCSKEKTKLHRVSAMLKMNPLSFEQLMKSNTQWSHSFNQWGSHWIKIQRFLMGQCFQWKKREMEKFLSHLLTNELRISQKQIRMYCNSWINPLVEKTSQIFYHQLDQYKIHVAQRLHLTFNTQLQFISNLLELRKLNPGSSQQIISYVNKKIKDQLHLALALRQKSGKKIVPLYQILQGRHDCNDFFLCFEKQKEIKPYWNIIALEANDRNFQAAHEVLFTGQFSWQHNDFSQPNFDFIPNDHPLYFKIDALALALLQNTSRTNHLFGIFNVVDTEIEVELHQNYKSFLGNGLLQALQEAFERDRITLGRIVHHNHEYINALREKANLAATHKLPLTDKESNDQLLRKHIFRATAPIFLHSIATLENEEKAEED